MYKLAALGLLLFHDARATIRLSTAEKNKHAFIKQMRAAEMKHGKIPGKQQSFDRLVAKSIHKPGLRANQAKDTSSKTTTQGKNENKAENETGGRNLSWYNWWQKNGNDTIVDEVANATEAGDSSSANSWYNWGNYGDDTVDDMWLYNGQNRTYIMDTLADFSMKYTGCASLTSFVGNEGKTDSLMENDNFVSYRLCPLETCEDESWNGCNEVYGEYLMGLEDFLKVQTDYVEEEFQYFCTYCEQCLYFDQWFNGGGDDRLFDDAYVADDAYQQQTDDQSQTHACAHYEECQNYQEMCEYEDEEGNDYVMKYEDFFECKEVDLGVYYDDDDANTDDQDVEDQNNEDGKDENYADYYTSSSSNTAYVGPHCNEGKIELALFSDEYCVSFIGNSLDMLNVTKYELEAETIQEVYVREDHCMKCNGDNIKGSHWYIPTDEDAEEEQNEEVDDAYYDKEEQYISEICYNMYTTSAKCHRHFTDDQMALELSDSESNNQESICYFIEDVVKGHINKNGFVYSHQGELSWLDHLYTMLGGSDDMGVGVTPAQVAALTIGGVGTAGMAALAYSMKGKVESATHANLIQNEGGVTA